MSLRTEDIVGVSFFALLIPAVVVTISASRTSLTAAQRAVWRGLGLGVLSGVFLAFGLATFYFIHNSPRPVVEGNLWDIRQFSSSRYRGAQFRITDATGQAFQIRCRYSGPGLQPGEKARVRYVEYNKKLMEMDMLTGSYRAWHLRESSGENGCWVWVALGIVCGFFAYRQSKKTRAVSATAP